MPPAILLLYSLLPSTAGMERELLLLSVSQLSTTLVPECKEATTTRHRVQQQAKGFIHTPVKPTSRPVILYDPPCTMLEQPVESPEVRGELSTTMRTPKLPQGAKCWPPPSPANSPPSRPRGLPPPSRCSGSEKRSIIEWPPRKNNNNNTTAHLQSTAIVVAADAATNNNNYHVPCSNNNSQTNDEMTNTSGQQSFSFPKGGIKRVVAWPPAPDSFVASDFQDRQGDLISTMNGVPLQANPPASLYYAPPPTTNYEIQCSVQQSDGFQSVSSPPVTLFTLPAFPPAPQHQAPASTVTLRAAAPISQPPLPVIKSQPAMNDKKMFRTNMRGDMKWPPPNVKAMQEAEKMATVSRGPIVKPKLCRKDYSSFFAQHALTSTYPGYRAPPGTQHYPDPTFEQQ